MSITVEINNVDVTDKILFPYLTVQQVLTSEVDTANLQVRALNPEFDDNVVIYDGDEKIFAGKVLMVRQTADSGASQVLEVACVEHQAEFDRVLASGTFEGETIGAIITSLVAEFAPGFTVNNVSSTFVIDKIVFNNVQMSTCMKRLADIISNDWYIDTEKDVHLVSRLSNPAPFDLTDTAGNYVYKSLVRTIDGSQVINLVKVRGGEYDAVTFTDVITVSGSETKSFSLPYRFANLSIEVDTGGGYVAKDVGIDNVDDFTTDDVLYNFNSQSIKFENNLPDGAKIRFSGNPKARVLAIAQDSDSIEALRAKYLATFGGPVPEGYGIIEKLIKDESIESNTMARKRAAAELLAFSESIIDARFDTYTAGLRTGMRINVQSDNRDFDDDLIIKSISFSARTPFEFGYHVECISTKRFNLIDLLRSFLEPDPVKADENEVAERLFPVNENIEIQDVASFIAPFFPEEEVVIQGDHYLDAVDPDDVNWVYGYYAPSSVSDVNRMAKYDRDSIYKTDAVAIWRMDEGAGTSIYDRVGGINGVATGINWVDDGDFYYVDFDANSTDKIDLPSTITLSAAFTITFMAKLGGADTYYLSICGNQASYSNGRLAYNLGGSAIAMVTASGGTDINLTANLPANEWHLFTITRDASNYLKAYIDTTPVHSGSPGRSGNMLINRIGYKPDNSGYHSWDGGMRNFRIYNRELTIAEIYALSKQ